VSTSMTVPPRILDNKSAEDRASFYVSSFEKLDDADDHGGDSDGNDEVPATHSLC